MNTEPVGIPGMRTWPVQLLFALAEPRRSVFRESDGCLVVPAVFKTVVDPADAGRGGFDSYPLRSSIAGKGVIELTREEIFQLTALSSCAG